MMNPTTERVLGQLHQPTGDDPWTVQRRAFLAAAAAGIGVLAMPRWLDALQSAARPLKQDEGVLVLLTMGGGNDGLNTFVPFADGAYRTARGSLALGGGQTLPFADGRGFNNKLETLKSKWDQGHVALIDGVGDTAFNDLSHFSSMARWMQGSSQAARTGWLGRYVDQIDEADDPFHSVSLGGSVPLVVSGARRRAIAIPHRNESLFSRTNSNPSYGRQHDALKALGQRAGGSRSMQQLAGQVAVRAVDLSDQLTPIVESGQNEVEVVTKLRLAAKLINANVGVRVISIIFGDFDSHSGQEYQHNQRMTEMETGLRAFYSTLNPDFEDRTLLMGVSEFGRRVEANGSGGTDHGTANTVFAVGSSVKGGVYGQLPSISKLDGNGNLKVHVDYRHVFSNVIDRWFEADSREISGKDYEDLGFLSKPGGEENESQAPVPVTPPPTTAPPSDTPPTTTPGSDPEPELPEPPADVDVVAIRRQIARLYLAYFNRMPDPGGAEHWLAALRSGKLLGTIATSFANSREFLRTYGSLSNAKFVTMLYQNILGRSPESEGLRNWTEQLNSGTTRGDIMVGFSESPEFIAKTETQLLAAEETGSIGRLYWAYFLRKPDIEGLHGWLGSELSTLEVSENFTESEEFKNLYGALDNRAFVRLVYQNVLEREPDAAGQAHWISELASGKSRGAIMIGFSDSAEFRKKVMALYPS